MYSCIPDVALLNGTSGSYLILSRSLAVEPYLTVHQSNIIRTASLMGSVVDTGRVKGKTAKDAGRTPVQTGSLHTTR
jgi:hypothetical protein